MPAVSKIVLLALAASAASVAISEGPLPDIQDGFTPEQVNAGCTLNMRPPFRPECNTGAGEHREVHARAVAELSPEIDLGSEYNGNYPMFASRPLLAGPPILTYASLGPEAKEALDHHLSAVVDSVGSKEGDKDEDEHKKRLAIGLGVGLGAGIPSIGLLWWLGTSLHTLGSLANGGDAYTSVMRALTTFRMDMIPHYSPPGNPAGGDFPARGGSPASEVAWSVDEWYDELCRQGNTAEQAAEIMNNFKADMAAAESSMANKATGVEHVVAEAAGRTFSNPSMINSWGVQAAAQVASNPDTSAGEILNALRKAGVPEDALESTAQAVSHVISQAPTGWIGRPAYNAALGVISSATTSASVAASEAAKAAVRGASGAGLAWSLGPAGVPPSAADATAAAMTEAIEAAKVSGADPFVSALNVISKAASPSGLAAAAAFEGASGSSLAPALEAAGVPADSVGATSDLVSAVLSADWGSKSAALDAAGDAIASAASPEDERGSNPAPPVSVSQAALDVVGASFNFWHTVPWVLWEVVNQLDANENDASDMDGLASLLAMGPPPDYPSRFKRFPYLRGGNRVTGLPSLLTNTSMPSPSSTHQGTQTGTPSSAPTLKPPPPGTGGYLYDGTKPAPSARA